MLPDLFLKCSLHNVLPSVNTRGQEHFTFPPQTPQNNFRDQRKQAYLQIQILKCFMCSPKHHKTMKVYFLLIFFILSLFFLLEDFTPVKYKLPPTPKPPKTLPPYNGFGSEEDSLSSCYGIQLRRPRKDLQSFLEKDRCDGSQLLLFHTCKCFCLRVRWPPSHHLPHHGCVSMLLALAALSWSSAPRWRPMTAMKEKGNLSSPSTPAMVPWVFTNSHWRAQVPPSAEQRLHKYFECTFLALTSGVQL